MVKDYKETAPCGMLIHYTVDLATDFVVYEDINGRGQCKKSKKCEKCSWKGLCNPTNIHFGELIERLKTTGNGSSALLEMWLCELSLYDYYIIYGFIHGLLATNFITEEEKKILLDSLIILGLEESEI